MSIATSWLVPVATAAANDDAQGERESAESDCGASFAPATASFSVGVSPGTPLPPARAG